MEALAHAIVCEQLRGFHSELFRGNGQPLAQLHWSGFVVQPCERNPHGAPNLWTELKRLAAHTLSMAMKTSDDM